VIAEQKEPEVESLGVGDTVVYAAHGVGRVVAREQKQVGDSERDCIVLELVAGGLRVTLPLEEAVERLRTVADEEELEDVRRTLVAEPGAREGAWTKRIKESKAKLASGRPTELAELVRDGSRFERSRGSQMSHAERRVYLQARDLLTREISSACRLEPNEAEAWIEAQITLPEGSRD
jgi:CarD family transcriptional regulator, regulator of rRNA transcription